MTTAGNAKATWLTWRTMLPADRAYLALPSSRRPLIVAEQDRGVLAYVRDSLLARPPRSWTLGWTYAVAREALRMNAVWSLAPRARPSLDGNLWLDRPGLTKTLSSGYRILLLNHNRDASTRFVLLLFAPGDCSPTVAVKFADAQGADRLHDENEHLRSLAGVLPKSLRATVPSVLYDEQGSQPILATTAQPGTSMFVAMNRRNHMRSPVAVRADFAAAATWLCELQSVTTGPAADLDVDVDTFAAAQRHLADAPTMLSAVLDDLLALQHRLRRFAVPRTVVHGDYWPGNLLVDRGTITGVIDWERAELAGSPVRDLARLAVGYSTYLDRHTRPLRTVAGHRGLVACAPGGGVTYAMDGVGWYPALVRRFLTDGLERLGLPSSLGPDVMRAEVAAIAAEATDLAFACEQWGIFRQACAEAPR
jgi:aminoglycoside phosphotransferase